MKGNNTIPIGGELESKATNKVVVSAEGVYDYLKGKSQEDVNKEFASSDETLKALYRALKQSNVVVVDANTDLPTTGEPDTIYRKAGDGSYTDYMWSDDDWVPMATYNNAIDNVPTTGSNNLVKSGGVASAIAGNTTDINNIKSIMSIQADIKIVDAVRTRDETTPNAGKVGNSWYINNNNHQIMTYTYADNEDTNVLAIKIYPVKAGIEYTISVAKTTNRYGALKRVVGFNTNPKALTNVVATDGTTHTGNAVTVTYTPSQDGYVFVSYVSMSKDGQTKYDVPVVSWSTNVSKEVERLDSKIDNSYSTINNELQTKGSVNLYNEDIEEIKVNFEGNVTQLSSATHRFALVIPVSTEIGSSLSVKRDRNGDGYGVLWLATSEVYPAAGVQIIDMLKPKSGSKASINISDNAKYLTILYYVDNNGITYTKEQMLEGMKVCYGEWVDTRRRLDAIEENLSSFSKSTPIVQFDFNEHTIRYDADAISVFNPNEYQQQQRVEDIENNLFLDENAYRWMPTLYEQYDALVNNDKLRIKAKEKAYWLAHQSQSDVDYKTAAQIDAMSYTDFHAAFLTKFSFNYNPYITRVDLPDYVGLTYPAYAHVGGNVLDELLYHTYMYVLSNSDNPNTGVQTPRRKMVWICGTHSGEISSQYTCYLIAKHLCECTAQDKNLLKLRNSFDIYIVPVLEGYGSLYRKTETAGDNTYLGRTNYNGVNLNRNFPFNAWKKKYQYGHQDYSGENAESEFETKLVTGLVEKLKPSMLLDMHGNVGVSNVIYTDLYQGEKDRGQAAALYQAVSDVSIAFKSAFPEYYGEDGDIVNAGPSPKVTTENNLYGTVACWGNEFGVPLSATIECPQTIAWNDGIYGGLWHHHSDRYIFGLNEYMYLSEIYHFAQWVLDNDVKEL